MTITIQMWFTILAPAQQSYMRGHYLHYLQGLKEGFLGQVWQLKMNNAYENQSFQQPGHKSESPTKFVVWRIMHTHLLVNSDNGGPLEVYLIMLHAPISWGLVINIDSIRSVTDLYSKITEHEKALVYASKMESSHPVTSENLLYNLRRVGILPSTSGPSHRHDPLVRHMNLGETLESTAEAQNENSDPEGKTMLLGPSSNDEAILKEAYQVLKQCQWAPPEGGYPFPQNNHIMMKLGCAPLSPCKVCGSSNHWDKECLDWNTFLEMWKCSGNSVFLKDLESEEEQRYGSTYSILLNARIAAHMSNWENSPLLQDFDEAAKEVFSMSEECSKLRHKSDPQRKTRSTRWVMIEEVDDEDNVKMRQEPKAKNGVLLGNATDKEVLSVPP